MRAPGGPRLLLRRLREVMAEPVTAQARLDRIVVLIASNMVAEVCSLYVVRADGAMELFATEGLNREAVHLTTMEPGEGLVGLIAVQRGAARAFGRAAPSGLLLQTRNGRRDLPVVSWRARAAKRRHDRGPGRAKSGAAHLFGRRGRGAADDGDVARRDDRVGRASGDRHPGRADRCPQSASDSRGSASPTGLASVMSCMHQPRVAVSKIVADDVDSELQRLEVGDRRHARLGRRVDRPQ